MEQREERALRLKRLKRKRMITVISLCAALCCLVGGYYLITLRNQRIAAEEARKQEEREAAAKQETKITSFELNQVDAIVFANEEDSYHFVWTEEEGTIGSWVRQGEEDFPTNEDKLQTIIGAFCGVKGTSRMVSSEVNPADYGLENTPFTVKLTLTDGTEHSFRLGDETPYADGYYFLYENTGEIFVVSSNVHTQLTTKAIKLVQAETFPSAEPESISELRIEVRGGETTSYKPETAEDGTVSYPGIFYDSVRFVASTVQEYNCTDFAKYGLDDPYVTVTIDYLGYVFTDGGLLTREPCTMVLEIGDKTVSDNYFVRVDGSDFVYIMVAAQAQKYLPK